MEADDIIIIQKKQDQDDQSSINSQGGGGEGGGGGGGGGGGVPLKPKPKPSTTTAAIAMMTRKDTEIESGEDGSNSSPQTDIIPEEEEAVAASQASGGGEEPNKNDCVIDIKHGGGGGGGSSSSSSSSLSDESLRAEKVCRICHMSSSENSSELIQLGCGCKDELGVSHPQCAETWFKHKGNRQCEICGKTAKNITGIRDTRIFMVEWNEMRMMGSAANPSSREGGSRRCRPSFCNFLLACLVLAFILPWFFRVDML